MPDRPVQVCALLITRGRPAWLKRALESLVAAARVCPAVSLRAVIGVNGPDTQSVQAFDSFKASAASLAADFALQQLNEARFPADARNLLLSFCRPSEWIFFIDDDAFVDAGFFGSFIAATERFPDAVAIGGPNLTPPVSGFFQQAAGAALACRFATFISVARYRSMKETRACGEESLILCNLFVRTTALLQDPFPKRFVCAEENWLLQDLAGRGLRLVHVPGLFVWHERRRRLPEFVRQVFNYGQGRGQNIRCRPSSLRPSHIVPSLCVLALPALLWPPLFSSILGLCGLYLLLVLGFATRVALRDGARRPALFLAVAALFPLIHVSYGAGVLRGLLRRPE